MRLGSLVRLSSGCHKFNLHPRGLTSRILASLFGFLAGSIFCLGLVLVRFSLVTHQITNLPPPRQIYRDQAQHNSDDRLPSDTPTLWIAADETWAWGSESFLHNSLYPTTFTLPVQNRAIPGRSARSYTTHGDWLRLRHHLQPRDFVLLSFGNNDFGDPKWDRWNRTALDTDDLNAVVDGFNGERVHSWMKYMQDFVRDIQHASAVPVLSTSTPFNSWDTKDDPPYYWPGPDPIPTWLLPKLAEWESVSWVDVWHPLADAFQELGFLKASRFQEDIHGLQVWNEAGARLAAEVWVRALKCTAGTEADALKQYLSNKALDLPSLC